MVSESDAFTVVLSPIGVQRPKGLVLAARPSDLNGKVLGLLDNGKLNADLLINAIAEQLIANFGVREVVRRSKRECRAGAAGPMSNSIRDEMIDRCDVVIAASGD